MNQTSSLSACYLRNPDVVLREEDENGCLLFNPDTNQIRILNYTGLFIWQMCDGSHTIADICASMCESFEGASEEQVNVQVNEFVTLMAQQGFVGSRAFDGQQA